MTSRPYAGRHRPQSQRFLPTVLRGRNVAGTAAAALLMAVATSASVAGQEPAPVVPAALDTTSAVALQLRADEHAQQHEDQVTTQAKVAAAHTRAVQTIAAARAQERAALARTAKRAKLAKLAKQKAALAKKAALERKRARAWVSPIRGAIFTSGFGQRWGRLHAGDDLSAPVGTPVRSMSQGIVTFAGYDGGYGNKLEIRYADGTVSVYAHLDSFSASPGQSVAPGQVVARSGNTGSSTGPHLHLEVHPGGAGPVDPSAWMSARGIQR